MTSLKQSWQDEWHWYSKQNKTKHTAGTWKPRWQAQNRKLIWRALVVSNTAHFQKKKKAWMYVCTCIYTHTSSPHIYHFYINFYSSFVINYFSLQHNLVRGSLSFITTFTDHIFIFFLCVFVLFICFWGGEGDLFYWFTTKSSAVNKALFHS